jgi:hypothetical protein
MTPREIFGLILRVCFLVLIYRGILGFLVPIVMLFGSRQFFGALWQALVPALTIAVSLYLLKGAPAVMRFCYPPEA